MNAVIISESFITLFQVTVFGGLTHTYPQNLIQPTDDNQHSQPVM